MWKSLPCWAGLQVLLVVPILTLAMPALAQSPEPLGSLAAVDHMESDAESLFARPAHLEVESRPLVEALATLQQRSGVPLAYSPMLLPPDRIVTCRCAQATVQEAIGTLLRGTGLEVVLLGEQLVIRPSLRSTAPRVASFVSHPVPAHPVPAALPLSPRSGRAGAVAADRQGTIRGRVLDATTLAPIGAAQVSIAELGIGVLSAPNGEYQLIDVPAGVHSVRVTRIGYREVSQSVTVSSGGAAQLDFALNTQALSLDEVVVTGTAGGTRLRAVGNAVGRVNAAEIAQVAPVMSIQNLIGPREPGVTFNRSTGNIGGGSEVRIRGTSSFNLGNQPLIYVDGVRVDNQAGVGPSVYDGRQATRLDDFNPEDIESIEIIKGPAAATLYGTEASAGVIQIITKKGVQGAPQFDLSIRQGVNWLMDPGGRLGDQYGIDRETGEVLVFNIWEEEKAAGRPFHSVGPIRAYNLSMRGGTDAVRYFLATDWDDSEGMVSYNWDRRLSFRANIGIRPSERLSLDISSGYIDGRTSFMQARTSWGMYEQSVWANPADRNGPTRGFMSAPPEEIANIQAIRDFNRFTGGLTLTHNPLDWLTQRLVLGTDVANDQNRTVIPRHPDGSDHFFAALSLGEITAEKPTVRNMGVDYAASASYAFNSELSFKTSYGVQFHSRKSEDLRTEGRIFPSPAITNMAGASTSTSTEVQTENKTLGMYLQQELSYGDRIFLTAAIRGDDNSAFGAEYDAALYPKLSATWVVSDEDFWRWDDLVSSLRLRTAWGQAGRQPDAFAAVTLYRPEVAVRSAPGVAPRVKGNPDVGPEVSTELELGFDASLFQDRISTQVTYYTQRVSDALLSNPLPPSSGFPGSQSVNLGQMSNWGWEVALDAQAVQRQNFGLDLGVTVTHNQNRVDDLGGRSESNTLREGFPYPAIAQYVITNAEWADQPGGRVTNVLCDGGAGPDGRRQGGVGVPCMQAPMVLLGSTNPAYEWSFNGTLRLMQNLRLFSLVELRHGDYWRASHLVGCRHWCFPNSRAAIVRDDPVWVAANSGNPFDTTNLYNSYYQAGFAKLREVSLSYSIPQAIVGRFGASQASLSVAGRELLTLWRAQKDISGVPIQDPEIGGVSSSSTIAGVPPLSSFVATLRMSF